jgi:hypothetical protein
MGLATMLFPFYFFFFFKEIDDDESYAKDSFPKDLF